MLPENGGKERVEKEEKGNQRLEKKEREGGRTSRGLVPNIFAIL